MARSKNTNRNRRARERERSGLPLLPAAERVQNAKEILDAVRHAAEDFQNAPSLSRANTAVRNFLEQARSVTWALETLESDMNDEAEWDAWWAENATKPLQASPAAQWFYGLRNPIVKEGRPVTITNRLQFQGALSIPPPEETRPEGATGYEIDHTFTPFWVMPDGTRVPAQPIEGVRRWNGLANTPEALRGTPLTELMAEYIFVLTIIVNAARIRFGAGEQ